MSLSGFDLAAAGGATLIAGAVNALAGGGTLVSFPTLVAIGVPALPANVTNTVALCPGYLSGTWAQRDDLRTQGRRVWALGLVAALGGLIGSALLEVTPESTFRVAVPWLLVLACALLLAQDRVRNLVKRRVEALDGAPAAPSPPPSEGTGGQESVADAPRPSVPLMVTVFASAVYGGFFGAGMGIMLIAVLGVFLDDSMVRLNAVKQALQFLVNISAAAFFAASGHVRWELVPIMAVCGVVGGTIGGRLSRRVNPTWLRRFVVVFGLAVAIDFWLK
jgi:uncharacterized membrane protein YfcA